jgi:hypothetical protein
VKLREKPERTRSIESDKGVKMVEGGEKSEADA